MPPTDEPSRPTRRSLLRAGAAAAATGLTTGASGCLSGLPPLGSKRSYGRVDVPGVGPPDYRRWLPAGWDRETDEDWVISYAEPGPFDGPVPEEFVARRGLFKSELDHFGIGYENYNRLVKTNLATVIKAAFAADEVASTLADTGYEPDGSYRGYDLYARPDVPRRVAVRDGVIVWTNRNRHTAPDLEATIDAGGGDADRYHEVDDAFAAVTEAVGASRFLFVGGSHPGLEPALSDLGADAFRIEDAAAYHLLMEWYPEGDEPSEERIKRELRNQRHELTSEAETVDIEIDGRLATVESRIPLAPNRSREAMTDPPQVTWGGSFDADTGALTIRHEAGESVDADWLWYDLEPADGPNEVEKEPLWPDRHSVGPGDEATVDLGDRPDAAAVNVVYGDDGVGFRMLFTYPLEEGE